MKYEVTFTYTARFTGEDGREKADKSFFFIGKVSGQALPRAGEEFYLDVRDEGGDEYTLVERVQHRPIKGIVHHFIDLEVDECVDPNGSDWDMDSEDMWVRDQLVPLMKKQGFVLRK